MSELGSGLSLDEMWDLYVDNSSGDLAFDDASNEVQKDIAFNLARGLQDVIGKPLDVGRRADVRQYCRRVVLSDPRIDSVDEVTVRLSESSRDELKIDLKATTVTGEEIDDIFTVS